MHYSDVRLIDSTVRQNKFDYLLIVQLTISERLPKSPAPSPKPSMQVIGQQVSRNMTNSAYRTRAML